MSLLQFWLFVFGCAYVFIASMMANIYGVPTPLSNRDNPPLLNLLILLTIWLPLYLTAIPVAALLRLLIPARKVNTNE